LSLKKSYILLLVALSSIMWFAFTGRSTRTVMASNITSGFVAVADSNEPDSLKYPFKQGESGGVFGSNPSNYKEDVVFDAVTGNYFVYQRYGRFASQSPIVMTPDQYRDYVARKQALEYWDQKTQSAAAAKAEGRDPESSLIPQIQVNSEFFKQVFGSNIIDIRPQGFAELTFGGRFQKIDNPIIPERNRNVFTFNFDQRIQMNVTGSIGEKMKVNVNYDTEATFAFENQVKLEFTGQEDDIIKKLEVGNVNLPLNSSLITGAQSLFGVKGQFQFGKLNVTGVFSEQRSQSSSINVQGGATTTEFEIWGDQYEANRHYFLAHYFRDNYEDFQFNAPLITSPVQITKVEVWVTNNRQNTQNTRNIVAFMDLGEGRNSAYRNGQISGPDIFSAGAANNPFPDNLVNSLDPQTLEAQFSGIRDLSQVNQVLNSAGFNEATEYVELANARRLNPNEFTFHPQLGYISLNTALNQDEVLGVSFQYTAGGRTFQVGEFGTDGVTPPNNLVVKMLKSFFLDVRLPSWDLMMKNVYSLSAFQVGADDFRLQVLYQNDETGSPVPFLPESNLRSELLLRVMDLDRLNQNNDPYPDGFFDFIPNQTIYPQNGRIFFPVLEPFGSHLEGKLDTDEAKERYVFNELYDSTRFVAQNETRLNKYLIKGEFKSSSSSEIQLNAFNIPPGSVSVTAGGTRLVEGQDYSVDYNLGRVSILNDGILNSGVPIKVDFENNALFNFQTKTFMGINAEYRFNENFNLGATLVNLNERPLTQKVNIGDEPISNTIIGMNGSYSQESQFLTRMVDAIPFIDTKEPSNFLISGEVARIIPGTPRGIEINGEQTTFLDDFESSQTTIDIRNPNAWRLASTPSGQLNLFPEASENSLAYGFNRARLAWYSIDPLFHNDEARTPDNIRNNKELQSTNNVREILVNEVFPNLALDPSQPRNIATLDLSFFPKERGPYNYDVQPTAFSAGISSAGELNDPVSRWGGIMRDITVTNFEEQNIEFIQFWVLNPFVGVDDVPEGGDLYFNLGSISEDILKDGVQAIENSIPLDGDLSKLDSTIWGYATNVRPPVVAFDADPAARDLQDVGYDLLSDQQERTWSYDSAYPNYIQRIIDNLGAGSAAETQANLDPAGDNFQYYRGTSLDQASANILERYKLFNNPQGNSNPTPIDGVSAFATNLPDIEDINRDQTLSKAETYFQYRVSMRPQDLNEVGKNYITDIYTTNSPEQPNGKSYRAQWIQFKIPVFAPDSKVGPINDFRSIRFIRAFLSKFTDNIVIRFARMELVRGEWRRYQFALDGTRDQLSQDDQDNTVFEVNAVNIEQNGSRKPIPYVLPPGIDRQVLFGTTSANQQNEQSLSLRILNLEDGDARAVFRNINFDMRLYKRLRLFSHLESAGDFDDLRNGDLRLFIRMGSDYDLNYYEYEIPLSSTPWDTEKENPELIWPSFNELDFPLNALKEVKLERNAAYQNTGAPLIEPYSIDRAGGRITVVGAPNLGNVRTILIGVRNPKKRLANDPDDGFSKSAEVWINELRLTGFDQDGGWAANARVAAKLADFANVSLTGRTSSIGFGSLDQSVSEFQQEEMYAYDLQSNVELGKFFNKDLGIRIPMFYGASETWINPRFNPLDPDIEFEQAVENVESPGRADSLRKATQDYTRRRSINFTNVRKERKGAKGQKNPQVYDIENFAASYSFSETFRRNINTRFDLNRQHNASLNYTYRTRPKLVKPFSKVSWLQSDYLALIRDFNFYPYPKSFTAIASLDRNYTAMQMRNTDAILNDIPPELLGNLEATYNKNFALNRQYTLLFDLTESLRFDYTARTNARVDELEGAPNTDSNRAEIMRNLEQLGRGLNYHQQVSLNWQLPLSKIPLLDFATISATYNGDYDWQAPSQTTTVAARNSGSGQSNFNLNFGNTIQNNRQLQLNSTFNFSALYAKVPYLKKAQQGSREDERRRPRGIPRPGRNNPNATNKVEEDEEDEEQSIFDKILMESAKVLMMVKSGSFNFSKSDGQFLPGFANSPQLFGLDNVGGNYAPGLWFTVGGQADIRKSAVANNWLIRNENLNNQYLQTSARTINMRLTAEPINSLRIVLSAQNNTTGNLAEFFRFDTISGIFESQNAFNTQTFSSSWFMLGTAFESLSAPDYKSATYDQFRQNRLIISQRMSSNFADITKRPYSSDLVGTPDSSNFGYRYFSVNSQDVMIPAFIAAYSGQDVKNIELGATRKTPLPNWQITYDGLTKMKFFKKYFNSFTLSHAYRSTYTVSNMTTNLLRQKAEQDNSTEDPLDNNGDLLPMNQINAVSLSEQFSPLIGINTKLKNNMTLRVEYKSDRSMILSLTNNQITETRGSEWVIGAGFIIKDVKLKFVRVGARKTNPVSNLELRADIGIRDNIILIRRILEEVDQPTSGQRITTVKVSADYRISQRVQTKIFYDLNMSRFKTSNAFPLTTNQFGISVRLNLGQ
jgi:cell surface protein SprA